MINETCSPENEHNIGDDVFGILTHATDVVNEVVILKSKTISKLLTDGMTEKEAEEYWSYNVAGAYGEGSYSCVDDMVDIETIQMMIDEDDEIIDPPFTGRPNLGKLRSEINSIISIAEDDSMTSDEKIARIIEITKNK